MLGAPRHLAKQFRVWVPQADEGVATIEGRSKDDVGLVESAEGVCQSVSIDAGAVGANDHDAFCAAVYVDDRPRAVRLNAGAALAHGAALLFLHADARVPTGFDAAIRETLSDRSISLGAFSLAIEGTQPALATIARGANWRSSVCKLPYGDQGLFCRASDFWRVGGFPPWPLLDDVALVRKLTRRGRLALLPDPITVSARRWQRLGPVRTTLLNQAILSAWFLGVPPETLARWYRR